MPNKKIFQILLLLLVFFVVKEAHAEIVFKDNFDTTPDWNTMGQFNGECALPSCSTAPKNWTNHYSNVTPSGPNNQTTVIGAIPDGGFDHTPNNDANKAYRGYFTNVYWSSGGGAELSKTLSSDYPELYLRVWVKTQPGFQMGPNGVVGSTASVKLFRISHYDRAGSAFGYFSGGTGAPMALLNIGRNDQYYPGDALNQFSYRCDPQGSVYQLCGGNYVDTIFGMPDRSRNGDFSFYMSPNASDISPSDPGGYADGQWHRYDMRVKMNTSVSRADGIVQVWYDGNLIRDDRGVQWGHSGSDGISGWNTVQFGGNSNNSYTGSPQWIAYDDIVVSTTAIPDDYVIDESVSSDVTAPITTASVNSGVFSSAQVVSLIANESATIYYTVDGSTPSESSMSYSSPLQIEKNTTLKYFAKDAAGNKESIRTQIYTINIPVTYNIANVVTLITDWLKSGTSSDINNDNIVNTRDLGIMMNKWK